MTDIQTANKALVAHLRRAMVDFSESGVRTALETALDPKARCRHTHPFGEMEGPDALWQGVYKPLFAAIPDLERRDYLVMAGPTDHGDNWVGTAGYLTGVMTDPWLDIPPTGHQIHMRFHEFYRIEDDRVQEVQALWDIPEVMMQARAWPMAPSLGREWCVPSPATQDGIVPGPRDAGRSDCNCRHVMAMLNCMKRHPSEGGPEVMEMDRFWSPRMNWYGPAGIGTCRGIEGFRNWHQIPFLRGMPDRGQADDGLIWHLFGDGNYVALTGWPNMCQTLTGDGWLGLVPNTTQLTLSSLDFWRIDDGLIQENWVLIDILDVYRQLGVDVFARLREFTKARAWGPSSHPAAGTGPVAPRSSPDPGEPR